ncbi:hypothetical protein Mapa_016982 [Marchantia paleacea]|nr:hypothetical protein Mapa_016982 [Marchantia paleacea]
MLETAKFERGGERRDLPSSLYGHNIYQLVTCGFLRQIPISSVPSPLVRDSRFRILQHFAPNAFPLLCSTRARTGIAIRDRRGYYDPTIPTQPFCECERELRGVLLSKKQMSVILYLKLNIQRWQSWQNLEDKGSPVLKE